MRCFLLLRQDCIKLSIYDQIGLQDMTIDNVYYERGINLRHGYLTEYYVEDAAYMVTLPGTLHEVGVLLEPLTVAEKGLNQAYEIQRLKPSSLVG